MKIVIPGGTGQVGTVLARAFHRDGHEVIVLSRRTRSLGQSPPWRVAGWDGATPGPWESEFEGADAVINLAGRSVNCRYGPENRRQIMDSRVRSARVVGAAIGRRKRPPRAWLQASTATIYAHRYDAPNDEATGILGGDEPDVPETWNFSIGVAKGWEQAAEEAAAPLPATRLVLLRSAITLNADPGSAFAVLLGLVKLGLGGTQGDGRQFVSWVHEEDFTRAVRWLIEREDLAGPVNIAAPGPVPNAEFMRGLRRAWGMPIGLPANRWMLEAGAFALRTETELILKSRRVVSGRLEADGFRFKFPEWPAAAADLCRRWRRKQGRNDQ